MYSKMCVLVMTMCCCLTSVMAHGPQIQTTNDAGKIVSREIVDASDYDTVLTDPKQVYVMPLAKVASVWRAQPDSAFIGWPGFAYGFGYDATTNPEPFPVGSKFVLGFIDGLKSWNGSAFADAGASEAEAYRGTSVAPSALARTSDSGPFASLEFPGGAGISYASEGSEVHNTVNYRMLGDGNSDTSFLPDGIYLLSMQLSSSDQSIAASDPFYFMLTKNGASDLEEAIAWLPIDSSLVQVIVPEPSMLSISVVGLLSVIVLGDLSRSSRQQMP